MGDAVLELVPSGEQGGPGRRARGTDVEVGEADTFSVETVEVRGFQDGVAVARQVAIALVVGQDEDDVGPLPGRRVGQGRGRDQEGYNEKREADHGNSFQVLASKGISPGQGSPVAVRIPTCGRPRKAVLMGFDNQVR